MKAFLFLICLLIAVPTFAQNADENRAITSVAFGTSGINRTTMGLRFDYLFFLDEKAAISFNVGVPFWSRHSEEPIIKPYGLGISAGIGGVYGSRDLLLDVELNYGFNEGPYRTNGGTVHEHTLGVFLGSRFQHREGGLFLKFGLTPMVAFVGQDFSFPLPGFHFEIGGSPRPKPYSKFSEKHPGFHPDHENPKRVHGLYLTAFAGGMTGKLRPYRNPARPSEPNVNGHARNFANRTNSNTYSTSRLGVQIEWKFLDWMAVSSGAYFGNETHALTYQLVELPSITDYFGEMVYDISNLYIPLNLHFDIGRRYIFGFQMGPYFTQILQYQAVGTFDGKAVATKDLAALPSPANNLVPQSTFGFSIGARMRIPIKERFHFIYAVSTGINRSPVFPKFRLGTQWKNMEIGLGVNLF